MSTTTNETTSTTARAYGSITIVDLTDVGSFSVYPESNKPLTVIYDQDANTYTPVWSAISPLKLKPIAYYAGKPVDATVTWFYRYGGSDTKTELTASSSNVEIGADYTLNIKSKTYLTGSTSNLTTFICEASYTDPISGAEVNASGQITFSMLKTAKKLKSCSISGDQVFMYGSDNKLKGSSTNILTAHLSEVSAGSSQNTNTGWFYYDTSKAAASAWTHFTAADDSNIYTTTLEITATHACFTHGESAVDKVRVKYVTSDTNIWDEISVYKLRDGVAGSSVYSVILTNEDQMIPFVDDETPADGAFNQASTEIHVYEGATDVSNQWNITADTRLNVTGSMTEISGGAKEYTVSGFTPTVTGETLADITTGAVIFKCTLKSDNNIFLTKRFTLSKVKVGTSPVIYTLEPDTEIVKKTSAKNADGSIKKDQDGNIIYQYIPENVTFKAYKQIYDNKEWKKEPYIGRLYSPDLNSQPTVNADSAEFALANLGTNDTQIKYYLYEKDTSYNNTQLGGGTVVHLDAQTVTILSDGEQGEKGEDGAPAISAIIGNPNFMIPCDSAGNVLDDDTVEIPFALYRGIEPISCSLNTSSIGLNVNYMYIDDSSILSVSDDDIKLGKTCKLVIKIDKMTDKNGTLTTSVPNDLGGNKGTLGLVLQHTDTEGDEFEVIEYANWVKSTQARGAVTFELQTPASGSAHRIHNGAGSVELKTVLRDGGVQVENTTEATPLVTYKWHKYNITNTTYEQIPGATSSALTVTASDVEGYASYWCQAKYMGETYDIYCAVEDTHDPVQAYVVCTLGNQIMNSSGYGAVYTKLTRQGEEIDPMPTEEFFDTEPSTEGLKSGYKYYHVDADNDIVRLREWNGSTWTYPTYVPQATYRYSFRNRNGQKGTYKYKTTPTASLQEVDTITDRVFYIDGELVSKKVIIDVEINV